MGSPSNDDSFVSISLDGKECDICLQDTGQELATCHVCARFLTAGPVQEGFNELPALIHTDTLAHPSCFQKFHKLARRLSHSSPKHQGISQTDDFRSTQWLNFNSNNLGKELLLENIRNRMSRSNPGSRSGSPSFSGGRLLGKPRDAERCSSEPFLDSSAQELHQGYTKYLFGNRETDSGQNVKVPEQRLPPVNSVGDQSWGPSEEVPSSSSIVCNSRTGIDCSLNQRSSKLDSNPLKSCQNEADQYLTKMQSLSIRGKQHQGHNWESPKAKAESCSDGTDSRTMHGCKRTKCGVETDITSCNGNREAKMKESIEKDVSSSGPPSDDKESWRDVRHIDKESLPNMSVPELQCHIEKLQSAVNDANSQLVQHLQEKDVLSSEVASRHITIKKLVERQKTLHH